MPGVQDRVIVVTGAGGGLGREYALTLAKEGASVVVNDLGGSRDGTGAGHNMADHVVKEIKDAGGRAVANYDSVAEAEGAENIIKTAIDEFGKVDGVVSNAGILRDGTFHKMEFANWDAVLRSTSMAPTTFSGRPGRTSGSRATAASSSPPPPAACSATSARPTTAPPSSAWSA